MHKRRAQGGDKERMRRRRVMQEANLQWNQPFGTQVDALEELATGPFPHVHGATILRAHFGRVEARVERVGGPELGGEHYVVTWLVPHIVAECSGVLVPAALDLEVGVHKQESALGLWENGKQRAGEEC